MVKSVQKAGLGDQKELFQVHESYIKIDSEFIKQNECFKFIEFTCLLALWKNPERKTITQQSNVAISI